MAKLSESDRTLLESLTQNGVLTPLNPAHLPYEKGAILLCCADGDQFDDLYSHHRPLCHHHRENVRLHMLALNGGPLLLPSKSPFNAELPHHRVLSQHIRDARRLKGMNAVVLVGHAPCGAAGLAGMPVAETLDWLAEGARETREAHPDARVILLFHFDRGDGRKRTYAFDPEAWRKVRPDRTAP